MITKTLVLGCFLGLVSLPPLKAWASERLTFNGQAGASSAALLEEFSLKTFNRPLSDIEFSNNDLNGDGLSEYIVRPKGCDHKICAYHIWAETEKSLISLGHVEAKTLLLGDERSHGVRNLLVFDSLENDFSYAVYAWEPGVSRFEKKDL